MIGGFVFMGLCCFGITVTVLYQVRSHLTHLSSWPEFLGDETNDGLRVRIKKHHIGLKVLFKLLYLKFLDI